MIEYKIKSANDLESAILITVAGKRDDIEQVEEYMDELEFLALTYGADTKKRFIQRLEKPDKSTYIGKGKIIITILCDLADRYKAKMFNYDFLKTNNLPIPKWLKNV